jgi:hypothetical protein
VWKERREYRLCDVVDYDCTVCVAVVHWGEGFITFLTCSIPYLEFDCCRFVESNCLSEECGSNLLVNHRNVL